MRKLIILCLSVFFLVGCTGGNEIISNSSSGEETTMNSLDDTYYKIYNAGASEIRENYYANHSSTKDFENIGRDLQLLSSSYFSTSNHYMSEGQYFGREERLELLQRKTAFSIQPASGTVIEGVVNPIMISDITEQDYWSREGNKYVLKGISLAIIVDPTDEHDQTLTTPMSDTTIKEYGKNVIQKVYKFIKESEYESMETIRSLPILITVYQGTDQTRSVVNGRYIYKSYCDNDLGQIVELNHRNVIFTSSEAENIDETTYVEFNQIKQSLKKSATEAAGLVGNAKYVDNEIQSMTIEANLNIKTITELQYLTSLLADLIDTKFTYDFDIKVCVYSQDGLKAVIIKDKGKDAKSSIFY